jgi:hypothetical protein
VTKAEWKLVALWAADEWERDGPIEWDDWYQFHQQSMQRLGIPADWQELRAVFEFCREVRNRREYAGSIEEAANMFFLENKTLPRQPEHITGPLQHLRRNAWWTLQERNSRRKPRIARNCDRQEPRRSSDSLESCQAKSPVVTINSNS